MYQMSQAYSAGASAGSYAGSAHSFRPSPLEYIAQSAVQYSPSEQVRYSISVPISQNYGEVSHFSMSSSPSFAYAASSHTLPSYHQQSASYSLHAPQREYHFDPSSFLKPGKEGKFIGKAEEIRPHIEEAFERIFHQPFPAHIAITICNQEQFRKIAPHPSTVGLSLNRNREGLLSEIFVLNDSLGRVMLTLGHELGHVLTHTLNDSHDEEAKAYAFSLAWMKIIQEHNIAGLADAFVTENPAQNGLHNVAFGYVQRLVERGKQAWDIYTGLVQGLLAVKVAG